MSGEYMFPETGCESCKAWQRRKSSYDDDIEFLSAHHFLQTGLMFDHVMVGIGVVYGNSDWTIDSVWNNALPVEPDPDIASKLDYKYLEYRKRKPSLYFPTGGDFQPLEDTLSARGWIGGPTDEWMTYNGHPPDPSTFAGTVDKVQIGDELDVFLHTLRRAHEDTDPYTNPYGPLSEAQSKTIARAWARGHDTGDVKYFIVYDRERGALERTPVAVASLTSWGDRFGRKMGLISNVGTDPDQRRHGYGRTATLNCISEPAIVVCTAESFRQGNTVHSLTTEHGKGPREAFLNMDFKTRLTAGVWTKEQNRSSV